MDIFLTEFGGIPRPDMEFVKKFTPPDFQKMSENGKIYTAGKKFTLPPAVTTVTNLTSGLSKMTLRRLCVT